MEASKPDILKLNTLVNKLDYFKNKIMSIDYIHDKKEFFDIMKEFRKYIALIEDEKLCDMFYHSKYYYSYKAFFREKNYFYMRAVECVEAFSIMTKWIHWKNSFIDLIDREYIKARYEQKINEMKSLDFSKAKTMLFVWCWPMPETMLFAYENTGIENIIWIDNSNEAVYIAWEMVRSLWLRNISLIHVDWRDYDYKNVDIVYIPWFAFPKNQILDRIVETWKQDVQILVNSSLYMQRMLFDYIWKNHNQRLKIIDKNNHTSSYYRGDIIKLVKYDF